MEVSRDGKSPELGGKEEDQKKLNAAQFVLRCLAGGDVLCGAHRCSNSSSGEKDSTC